MIIHYPEKGSWVAQLKPEQRPSFTFVIERAGVLLISEVSAGKTYISMAALEYLTPTLTLVVAPLTSLDITWSPKLRSLNASLHRDWEGFKAARRKPGRHILLIHFQLFAKLAKKLEGVSWSMVIIDESQGIKDRASQASRAARRMRHATRRLALSATPLDKTPIDIFAQMRFVDHTVLGEDFADFKSEFTYEGGFKGYELKFRPEKLPALLKRLEGHIFRLDKGFLKLKPIHVHMVPVQLLGEQRRLYEQMAEHGIVQINGTAIPAPLKVSREVKLQQITGGTIKEKYIEEKKLRWRSHHIGNAKARKLSWLLSKIDPPVVIFCKYLAEIPLIEKACAAAPGCRPARIRVLTGGVVGDERTDLINIFQAGGVDYLICQMRTGGVSIELTAASTLIFYSMNFSLIDFEQVCGRFHRGSQTREVNVYVLYATDTIDQEIADQIEAKKETFFSVVRHFTQSPVPPNVEPAR